MAEATGSLRRSLTWAAIAFGVTLAIVVGLRLEQAALTVAVGLACGVGASALSGVLLLALLHHRQARRDRTMQGDPRLLSQTVWQVAASPTVQRRMVVVAGPQTPQARAGESWLAENPVAFSAPRQFRVVGEEGTSAL
jgi:Na+(H+)/acetate symporter ActP